MNRTLGASHQNAAGNILSGLIAGCAGGALGSYLMNKSHAAVRRVAESSASSGESSSEESEESSGDSEPATVAVASRISRKVAHRELTEEQKPIAGNAVHYGYGTLMGGLYGAVAEFVPEITFGQGTAYGAALWLMGDEIAIPALGFSGSPLKTPLSTHAEALAAHIAYGLATEAGRRGTKALFR